MQSKFVLLLSALLCLIILAPAGAGVLGVLEIRGIDNLGDAVLDLTQAVGQPVPKEMVTMGLHSVLGTPAGVGLVPNGTLRILWLENGAPTGTGALVLAVPDDGSAYLAALEETAWTIESETVDGLVHLAAPDEQFSLWQEVYVLKGDGTLIVAETAADVRLAAEALPSLPSILPAEGVVAIQICPAALVNAFEPEIREQMDRAFAAIPDETEPSAAVGRLYMQGYLAAARQIQSVVKGIAVGNGNLSLHLNLTPVADSLLAQWIATIKTPAPATGVVNLPGALFVDTLHLGDMQLLAPTYFRYMNRVLQAMPATMPADALANYMEGIKTYWEQSGSDFGIALLPPTRQAPVRIAEYLTLKNPAALRELTASMVSVGNEMMKAAMGTIPEAPFQIELVQEESRDYREIPIDRLTYRLQPGETLATMWPAGRVLELSIEQAWLPDAVLVGIGGQDITDLLVDRALDGTAAPVAENDAWQSFFPHPEPAVVELAQIAVFDGLRNYLGLLDGLTDNTRAEFIPAGPGHLAQLAYRSKNGIMARLRFSLADLSAIVTKVEEAQERAAAARQTQMEALQRELEVEGYDFQELDDDDTDDWYSPSDDIQETDDWEIDVIDDVDAPAIVE